MHASPRKSSCLRPGLAVLAPRHPAFEVLPAEQAARFAVQRWLTWRCNRCSKIGVEIIKLAWVGTRTDNADPTVAFFRDVLGLRLVLEEAGSWKMKLPDGSNVEVFGPDTDVNRHFTTGPVAGFLVDDVQEATVELRSADVEVLLGPVTDVNGSAWVHFRAPDGNIYELTQDPEVYRPA